MASLVKCALLLLSLSYIRADEIDNRLRKGVMLKILREMVNQTKADTLNLPANATSIRENITDTFSCENRTYGYYADVDNDCQIFHVCLTQMAASQRNMTFRWSFICPNETIFNQEVLTCARPRDSIRCEDAPMYYDVNMEIGKVTNDTANEPIKEKDMEKIDTSKDKKVERNKGSNKKNPPNRRKENLIQMLEEVVKEDINIDDIGVIDNLEDKDKLEETTNDKETTKIETIRKTEVVPMRDDKKPIIHEVGQAYELQGDLKKNSRIIAERSLKRRGKKYRGSFRFKADV